MNVCVIGSGGREHALAWKLSKSSNVNRLFCIPGNGGTQSISENVSIPLKYPFNELVSFINENRIDLVVIGPEAPLVDGIVDILTSKGIKAFGPTSGASRIEGSKVFAKMLMKKNKVPTADFEVFEDFESAKSFFEKHPDWVIKFDGLAGGKGVVVPSSMDEGVSFLEDIFLKDKFSSTNKKVIMEKRLEGYELSVFVITDGEDIKFLSTAQDHKRAFDGDKGPNTGGMGAYAPVPIVSKELVDKIMKKIVYPTIEGLSKEGITYKGVLYCGLMIDKNDEPYVLEFNCRFGDPEAQVVLPIMKTDFYDVASATVEGLLRKVKFEMYEKFAGCVVLASKGYPGDFEKGKEISGDLSETDDVIVFHAGTTLNDGKLITSGGRVLNIVGLGSDLKQALNLAYSRIEKIHFDGMFYRKDIGWRII